MKVGFVGLGRMGQGMARRLLDAGQHGGARRIELRGDLGGGLFQLLRHDLVDLAHLAGDANGRVREGVRHLGGGLVD
ncbi:MAG: hypothetical protein EHM50_08465, partial [Lysobacterales bacterium]